MSSDKLKNGNLRSEIYNPHSGDGLNLLIESNDWSSVDHYN